MVPHSTPASSPALHFEAKGTGLRTGRSGEDRAEMEEPGNYKEENKHKWDNKASNHDVYTFIQFKQFKQNNSLSSLNRTTKNATDALVGAGSGGGVGGGG